MHVCFKKRKNEVIMTIMLLTIISLLSNVSVRRVVIEERCASKANTVKIKDNINTIHGSALIAYLHPAQNNLVEKLCKTITSCRLLIAYFRQTIVSIHEVIKIQLMNEMFVPILVRNKFPFSLE